MWLSASLEQRCPLSANILRTLSAYLYIINNYDYYLLSSIQFLIWSADFQVPSLNYLK